MLLPRKRLPTAQQVAQLATEGQTALIVLKTVRCPTQVKVSPRTTSDVQGGTYVRARLHPKLQHAVGKISRRNQTTCCLNISV